MLSLTIALVAVLFELVCAAALGGRTDNHADAALGQALPAALR